MDTYKRKINLRHFAPQSGANKDIVVNSDNCFLPHTIIKDKSGNTIEELPIKWETYNHYKGWLESFIVESEIYEIRKRDDEFVFVNAREYNEDYLKTEESTKISLTNSNQFFYNVYKNSVKKYPYLHILKNKINKMRKFDLSQSKNKLKERNRTNNKITLLDKINSQKDIFQREIEKYNSK